MGVLLIVALGVLALGTFLIGEMGNVFGERYRLVTLMESAAGLVQGAPVHLAGQPVGQVAEIELLEPGRRPPTGEPVALWLAIDRSVMDQIRANSAARVRTQGLLGDKLIDIEPGSPPAPVLDPGDTISSAPALNYQEVLDQASEAVRRLTDLVENLSGLTEGLLAGEGTAGQLFADDALYDHVVDLSGSLDRVLSTMASGEGTLGRMLRSDSLYERLLASSGSLDSLTSGLVDGRGTLGKLVQSDSLYRSLTELASRSDSLLSELQRGRGTLGQLMVDQALYDEMLRTVTDLNAVLQDLRENPGRYIPPVKIF